ncbi:MAG: peptidoglycan-binding domain-containing protein [Terracidiphilus sp.]
MSSSRYRVGLALLVSAVLLAPPLFATNAPRTTTSSHGTASHKLSHGRHRSRRARGQREIQPDRVTQIQQALIREHYFTGEANGNWDSTTVAAMQKYQADHGWQTKLMPDSRALKSLGLGPDYSTALNANGSSFAAPPSTPAPASQNSGFIAASGVNQ